jgi:ABC-type transport system involved in cytochrome c biogenesis permease component
LHSASLGSLKELIGALDFIFILEPPHAWVVFAKLINYWLVGTLFIVFVVLVLLVIFGMQHSKLALFHFTV